VATVINIHNGDAVLLGARKSGVPGEHSAFRESLVIGPIPPVDEWKEVRARFLSANSGEDLLRTSNNIFEQEQMLNAAAESDDEIVLWFEHDLFCLVHFLYLLNRFRGRNVSFVWCTDPLALKPADELAKLFESRATATPGVFDYASRAWAAYASSDPRALNDMIAAPADLPFVREGLQLHGSRFPSVRNGLGSVENRLLKLIAGGAPDFATIFPLFDDLPPRFGFGDAQVLFTLRAMASRPVPLVTLTETNDTQPPKVAVSITSDGENVLNGKVDDIAVNDPDIWLGGVHVTKENVWRWDESRGTVVKTSRSANT
jgi:hypothetical protein